MDEWTTLEPPFLLSLLLQLEFLLLLLLLLLLLPPTFILGPVPDGCGRTQLDSFDWTVSELRAGIASRTCLDVVVGADLAADGQCLLAADRCAAGAAEVGKR